MTRAYYALLTGQRKYATAQQALDQAKRYLDISQSLERGGEVAHSDVVRADFQYSQQEQAFREAKLAMDNARLDLAVLLFRDFDQNFTVVDDLNLAPALPAFTEVQTMAERENPDLRAANAALRAASLDVIDRAPGVPAIAHRRRGVRHRSQRLRLAQHGGGRSRERSSAEPGLLRDHLVERPGVGLGLQEQQGAASRS